LLPTFGQEMSGDERDLKIYWGALFLGWCWCHCVSGEVLWSDFDYLLVLATVEMLDLILFLSFFYSFLFNPLWSILGKRQESGT
jgi:hypothetical protein